MQRSANLGTKTGNSLIYFTFKKNNTLKNYKPQKYFPSNMTDNFRIIFVTISYKRT